MNMIKKFSLLMLAVSSSVFASSYTALYEQGDIVKNYNVGEMIVLPIPLSAFPTGTTFTCLSPHYEDANGDAVEVNTDFVPVANFKNPAKKVNFFVNQCQEIYKKDEHGNFVRDAETGNFVKNTNDWHNAQDKWIELLAYANETGEYEGSVYISGTTGGKFVTTNPVDFKFTVGPALSNGNGGKFAVLFLDSSASYKRQIDINTFVKNNSASDEQLKNAHVDYYVKASSFATKPKISIWYNPNGQNACVQVYRCSDNNYVIRHKLLVDKYLANGGELSFAQIGYEEPSTKPIEGDKSASKPENQDYSYTISTYNENAPASYEAMAHNRNKHYNSQMALYSDGQLVWGTLPSWLSSCQVDTRYYGQDFCNEDVTTDEIYEGEDYFAMPEMPYVEGVHYELEAANPASVPFVNVLEIGTPADYWSGDYDNNHNNNVNTERNRRIIYVRSRHGAIRNTTTITPGTYTYKVNVVNESTNQILNSIVRTVVVKEGADHSKASGKNVAVLMGDETWFKKYQLDIASGLVNFSDQYVTLSNFHYDYYGRVNQKELINGATNLSGARYQPHYWYSHPGYDVSFTDCGSGYFRVRYSYSGQITIFPNHTAYDNKAGFVYATGYTMTKSDDYSMSYWPGEVSNRRRYSPYTPLYNNGQLIWGEEPSWAHSCDDGTPIVDPGSSGSGSGGSGSGGSGSGDPTSSASGTIVDVPQSSSSFDAFTDLAVRYMDNTNNPVTSDIPVLFDIVNKGSKDASLNGYTVRFYYNDTENGDAAKLSSLVYYSGDPRGQDIFASVNTQKCAAGKYAADFKFSNLATVKAGDKFPQGYVQAVLYQVNNYTEVFNKKNIYSWEDYKELTENSDIVLFNPNGDIVFGKPAWECNGYTEKELKLKVTEIINENDYTWRLQGQAGKVTLNITNIGDLDYKKPLYVNFYVKHGNGQVPVILFNNQASLIASANIRGVFNNGVSVVRHSSGDKHTFVFTLPNGLNSGDSKSFTFWLADACLNDCPIEDKSLFKWNFADDWSAKEGYSQQGSTVVTNHVFVTNDENEKLYGEPDPNAPAPSVAKVLLPGEPEPLKQPRAEIDNMRANRTDAVAYSGGQLLSGGDFEDDYLRGWTVSGTSTNIEGEAVSVRGASPQGSRYLDLKANSKISQEISDLSLEVLRDSGATLTFWMNSGDVHVTWPGHNQHVVNSRSGWVQQAVPLDKSDFQNNQAIVLSFYTDGNPVFIDDAILVPGNAKPVTYATRFTNMANEEIESRAYDGDKEQLVTTSQRDEMGREWKKYLPYSMPCDGVVQCNSDMNSMYNPTTAEHYYVEANPNYPDAKGYPYAETRWKPDPMATKDVVGNPGQAFSLRGGKHYTRVYSSGVNMDGVEPLNTADLSNAVSATNANSKQYSSPNPLNFDSENYHALADKNPTHLWELTIDPNGNKTFTVKDGEGLVIVSGALDENGNLASRTVNRYDANGNLTVVHSPMSCLYSPQPANCVDSTEYKYDSENHLIESIEPDAGITRTYYDRSGRVRATQTQKQILSKTASVTIYDNLDRAIATGEWKHNKDESALRSDLLSDEKDASNKAKFPHEEDLTPGTVTRTFYDKAPSRDTLNKLGVDTYPSWIEPTYIRGRVAAVISDVKAVLNDDGSAVKSTSGSDSVVRVSTANSYDKYGRVIANYAFDPTMPADSLKMLAVETEFDLGGKVTMTKKYPFGLGTWGHMRMFAERFTYDRLGRVDKIFSNRGNGEQLLAHYEYYPTGAVKKITMGNSLTLSYTNHISGAVKTAKVNSADDGKVYSETLYYEDCGDNGCTPQYNGNISRMAHEMAVDDGKYRDVQYTYDFMNRLVNANDALDNDFDEIFTYDAQGRITVQRRAGNIGNTTGGEYAYEAGSNRLKSVANGMGGTADSRDMSDQDNFVYDSEGNLIEDKSKGLTISYDWRGMPVEFTRNDACIDIHEHVVCGLVKLVMAYDGSGRRISKTRMRDYGNGVWVTELVTHYTGIGTEIRENIAGATPETKVVVNMPQGLGRYGIEDAIEPYTNTNSFEWFLKNHLGSTMLVYGTQWVGDITKADVGTLKAAYDYRAFGEQVSLTERTDKVTENFTGKELDDEIELNYFGARYLDPMLGLWISVDPARQFASPYLYAGNGVNPVNGVDPNGNILVMDDYTRANYVSWMNSNVGGDGARAERVARFNALEESSQVYKIQLRDGFNDRDFIEGQRGTYDIENKTAIIDGTMENFFHEVLGHMFQDEDAFRQTGSPIEQTNAFDSDNDGRNRFLGYELDARMVGNSRTPADYEKVIETYGAEYDMTYGVEVK